MKRREIEKEIQYKAKQMKTAKALDIKRTIEKQTKLKIV